MSREKHASIPMPSSMIDRSDVAGEKDKVPRFGKDI